MPSTSERRLQPYVEDIEETRIVVPHPYAQYFDYGYRVMNIKDRYGNTIINGSWEVVDIQRSTGWNGKLSYLTVRLRLVVES